MKKVFMGLIIVLVAMLVSCGNENDINKLVDELSNAIDFNVSYIKDRNVIRIDTELDKETVEGAVMYDEIYCEWVGMRNSLDDTYKMIDKLVSSKDIKDLQTELLLFDSEDNSVPLLIINKDGVVFDIVEKALQ